MEPLYLAMFLLLLMKMTNSLNGQNGAGKIHSFKDNRRLKPNHQQIYFQAPKEAIIAHLLLSIY